MNLYVAVEPYNDARCLACTYEIETTADTIAVNKRLMTSSPMWAIAESESARNAIITM